MKIILKEDLTNVGKEGDIVEVANGFGRNYLVPKGHAVIANAENIKQVTKEKELKRHRAEKSKREAEELAQKITRSSCSVARKSGENEKLFGSVTTQDIAEVLQNQGIKIDKKNILLEEPLKNLGDFIIPIKLHPEVIAQLTLSIIKEE